MKKIVKMLGRIMLLNVLTLLASCVSTEVVSYQMDEEIITVTGKSKSVLFDSVNKWAVQTFNKTDSVLEYSNAESGTVSGKYVFNTHDSFLAYGYPYCKSIITVECKDGKVRLSM